MCSVSYFRAVRKTPLPKPRYRSVTNFNGRNHHCRLRGEIDCSICRCTRRSCARAQTIPITCSPLWNVLMVSVRQSLTLSQLLGLTLQDGICRLAVCVYVCNLSLQRRLIGPLLRVPSLHAWLIPSDGSDVICISPDA
jgi:hypothetical protein